MAEGLVTLGPREKATSESRLEGHLGRELFLVEEAAMVGTCVAGRRPSEEVKVAADSQRDDGRTVCPRGEGEGEMQPRSTVRSGSYPRTPGGR